MKKNIGNVDKVIRLLFATVFGYLYFTNVVTGTFGIMLLVLVGILVLTSMISFCPLYTLLGTSTRPLENK